MTTSVKLQIIVIFMIIMVTLILTIKGRSSKKNYKKLWVEECIKGKVTSVEVKFLFKGYGSIDGRGRMKALGNYGLILGVESSKGKVYKVVMEESNNAKAKKSTYWDEDKWLDKRVSIVVKSHPNEEYSKALKHNYKRYFIYNKKGFPF